MAHEEFTPRDFSSLLSVSRDPAFSVFVPTTPPPGTFSRKCVVPLPQNTTLLAQVKVRPGVIDSYFEQRESVKESIFRRIFTTAKTPPGSLSGKVLDRWVCRSAVSTAQRVGGAKLDPIEAPKNPEARPVASFVFSLDRIGQAVSDSFRELGTVAKFAVIGGVGLLVLFSVASLRR